MGSKQQKALQVSSEQVAKGIWTQVKHSIQFITAMTPVKYAYCRVRVSPCSHWFQGNAEEIAEAPARS